MDADGACGQVEVTDLQESYFLATKREPTEKLDRDLVGDDDTEMLVADVLKATRGGRERTPEPEASF